MTPWPVDALPIRSSDDLRAVREMLRAHARLAGLNDVDQVRFVTAGSELARNIVKFTPGGAVRVERLTDGARVGVRASFVDHGPGIADVRLAMQDGFSTAGSLGIGLPGARRLVDDFELESTPGRGTTVVIVRWVR